MGTTKERGQDEGSDRRPRSKFSVHFVGCFASWAIQGVSLYIRFFCGSHSGAKTHRTAKILIVYFGFRARDLSLGDRSLNLFVPSVCEPLLLCTRKLNYPLSHKTL